MNHQTHHYEDATLEGNLRKIIVIIIITMMKMNSIMMVLMLKEMIMLIMLIQIIMILMMMTTMIHGDEDGDSIDGQIIISITSSLPSEQKQPIPSNAF